MTIPEKMFQQVLALGEAWQVVRMDYQEKEQKVLIRVADTPALWAEEPKAFSTASAWGWPAHS